MPVTGCAHPPSRALSTPQPPRRVGRLPARRAGLITCPCCDQCWLVPDDLSAAGDEVSAMRPANARLRQVADAKDTEIAALRAALEAARARHDELVRGQAELTRSLELRVAGLERRLGMDSGNSSTPPSKEPLARRHAGRRRGGRRCGSGRRTAGRAGSRAMKGPGWSRRASRTGPSGPVRPRSAARAGRAWPAPP